MRKIILWIGRIPASIKRAATVALPICEKILRFAQSGQAIVITSLIPGDADEQVRKGIIEVLSRLLPILRQLTEDSARKAIAARIGAEITAVVDGKQEAMNVYVQAFEKTLGETRVA